MIDIAARNRAIKASMEEVFGRGKVRVGGSRGTAWGYVKVTIDHTPLDWDAARLLATKLKERMRDDGIDLGHAYTDDTCQYDTDQCRIEFNRCRYIHTFIDGGGARWGKREEFAEYKYERVEEGEAA